MAISTWVLIKEPKGWRDGKTDWEQELRGLMLEWMELWDTQMREGAVLAGRLMRAVCDGCGDASVALLL